MAKKSVRLQVTISHKGILDELEKISLENEISFDRAMAQWIIELYGMYKMYTAMITRGEIKNDSPNLIPNNSSPVLDESPNKTFFDDIL